jgi:hypothetical protein
MKPSHSFFHLTTATNGLSSSLKRHESKLLLLVPSRTDHLFQVYINPQHAPLQTSSLIFSKYIPPHLQAVTIVLYSIKINPPSIQLTTKSQVYKRTSIPLTTMSYSSLDSFTAQETLDTHVVPSPSTLGQSVGETQTGSAAHGTCAGVVQTPSLRRETRRIPNKPEVSYFGNREELQRGEGEEENGETRIREQAKLATIYEGSTVGGYLRSNMLNASNSVDIFVTPKPEHVRIIENNGLSLVRNTSADVATFEHIEYADIPLAQAYASSSVLSRVTPVISRITHGGYDFNSHDTEVSVIEVDSTSQESTDECCDSTEAYILFAEVLSETELPTGGARLRYFGIIAKHSRKCGRYLVPRPVKAFWKKRRSSATAEVPPPAYEAVMATPNIRSRL